MPSPFDITAASNTVSLDKNNRSGVASFTAKNNARRRIHATAKLAITLADDKQPISTVPPDAPKWLSIAPPPPGSTDSADSREFAIDGTQNYQVNILVPMTAPAASYKLKLTLADEVNPDDNFSDSPDVIFTVPAIPPPPPKPFPMWIIAAVIVVILLIIVIAVVAISSANTAHVHETETAVAVTEEETLNALGTQGAVNALGTQNAVGTQNAAGTQNAINALGTQNAVGTQTALGLYVGDWVRTNNSSQPVTELVITDAGSNQLSVRYTIPRQPCIPVISGNLILNCRISIFTPTPFQTSTIPSVLFNSTQINASDSVIILQISPASGQLIVSSTLAGTTSVQNFRH